MNENKRFTLGGWARYPTLLIIDNEKSTEYNSTECCKSLNELYEENKLFKDTTIALIKEYLDIADEQDGMILGNAPVERASALIELLKELRLSQFLKDNGIEVFEDDDVED